MSDHIPPEVVFQILIRCEVPTVLRWRCVSKQWRAVIDDPDFIKHHTNNSITFITDYSSYCIDIGEVLYTLDLEASGQLYSKSPDLCNILLDSESWYFVGSCNGLLCLQQTDSLEALILNPCTLEKLRISNDLPSCFSDQERTDGIRIGYVETGETKELAMPYFIDYGISYMGMLTGGALHWLVRRSDGSTGKKRVILGFDLGTEEFRELPQPEYSATDCKISMSLLGTWLCICANDGDQLDFDIWVMKEYGVTESWTKLFSIPYATTFLTSVVKTVKPLGFSKNGGQVLLDFVKQGEWGRCLVWYDIKKKKLEKIMKETCSFESIICLRCLTLLPSIHSRRGGCMY
ncbi:F-box protein CPR1-like [Mercurialis annua]|uniref:F-box protein CPR1-like n=1 Tax=Mercurialis annua TaxID=3986 RepID=UPI00215FF113|nr:F-box protein CPR1-like [Mercurialis annua]